MRGAPVLFTVHPSGVGIIPADAGSTDIGSENLRRA